MLKSNLSSSYSKSLISFLTLSISSVVCGVPPAFMSMYHCNTSFSVFRLFT
nr:MAG TPA: hypothetical protein [Caudoviricetes sp.]DAT99401.1 MAG TPA: hypothetical protein [Caudoviricetes sp.]